MEIETIREYIKRNPALLESLKKIMDYRRLRTEQVYYAKLSYQYDNMFRLGMNNVCPMVSNAGEFKRGYWKDRSIELDKQRRSVHNRALGAFSNIIKTGRLYGYPKLYSGKVLEASEIENYTNLDDREKITNAMFELLSTIEKAQQEELAQKKLDTNDEATKLAYKMRADDREFHVKPGKGIKTDDDRTEDGGIEFDFDTIWKNMFEND